MVQQNDDRYFHHPSFWSYIQHLYSHSLLGDICFGWCRFNLCLYKCSNYCVWSCIHLWCQNYFSFDCNFWTHSEFIWSWMSRQLLGNCRPSNNLKPPHPSQRSSNNPHSHWLDSRNRMHRRLQFRSQVRWRRCRNLHDGPGDHEHSEGQQPSQFHCTNK